MSPWRSRAKLTEVFLRGIIFCMKHTFAFAFSALAVACSSSEPSTNADAGARPLRDSGADVYQPIADASSLQDAAPSCNPGKPKSEFLSAADEWSFTGEKCLGEDCRESGLVYAPGFRSGSNNRPAIDGCRESSSLSDGKICCPSACRKVIGGTACAATDDAYFCPVDNQILLASPAGGPTCSLASISLPNYPNDALLCCSRNK